MKLAEYDVTIRVADPDDPETFAEATVRRGQRDPLLAHPIVGKLVRTFEEMVEEDVPDGPPPRESAESVDEGNS